RRVKLRNVGPIDVQIVELVTANPHREALKRHLELLVGLGIDHPGHERHRHAPETSRHSPRHGRAPARPPPEERPLAGAAPARPVSCSLELQCSIIAYTMSLVHKIPPLVSALAFGYGVGMAAPDATISSVKAAVSVVQPGAASPPPPQERSVERA